MQVRLLLLFLIATKSVSGQSLKTEVDSIYNFKPSALTKAEQETKLPAMDKFWDKIKSDTTNNLPLLRNELIAPNHNPFFYYDGMSLLMSLSQTSLDKKIAAQAIAKCDISDIDRKLYVSALNNLANDQIDVTSAAIKILADTGYSFFLPQHAMTFTQGYCLTYMLVPQKPELYTDTLISIFKKVNPIAQKSIITVFWFAYTCKGDSLINSVLNDESIDKDVRKYAKEATRSVNLSKEQKKYAESINKDELGQLRKQSLLRFSDEALDDLLLTTTIIRKDNKCR